MSMVPLSLANPPATRFMISVALHTPPIELRHLFLWNPLKQKHYSFTNHGPIDNPSRFLLLPLPVGILSLDDGFYNKAFIRAVIFHYNAPIINGYSCAIPHSFNFTDIYLIPQLEPE